LDPVVFASRFTIAAWEEEGRLRTHSPVRMMFSVVFENALMPIMHRHPSQNTEDIGARFAEPSSLVVLIKTTGVPKYKIAG